MLDLPSSNTIYDTIDSRSLVKTIVRELKLDEKIYKAAEVFGRISAANVLAATGIRGQPRLAVSMPLLIRSA